MVLTPTGLILFTGIAKLYNLRPLCFCRKLGINRQGGDNLSVIAAGLPNIIGMISGIQCVSSPNASGAFTITRSGGIQGVAERNDWQYSRFDFNAAIYNAIYGAASTVQPPSITLLPQIKY